MTCPCLHVISECSSSIMASKLGTIESLMQCPICLEDFKDPRILPCLHTLCRVCLERHVSASSQRNQFYCPSCRHECQIPRGGLSAMPKNFFLNSFKELLEGQFQKSSGDAARGQSRADGKDRVCDYAKFDMRPHGTVTSFCVSCAEFYCEACASFHSKTRATRDHKLCLAAEVDAKTLSAALRQATTPHCEQHLDTKLELYCDSCEVAVCAKCCLLSHQQHKYRELATVAQGCQGKLEELSKTAAAHFVTLDKHAKELKESETKIRRDASTARQEVQQAAYELRDLVTKRERYLIQQIQDKEKAALVEVNAAAKETELSKGAIESLQSYMETLQESGSFTDQVAHTPGLQEQLSQQQAAPLKTVGLTACFKKETNSVTVLNAMLGTVSTERSVAITKPGTTGSSDTVVVEMVLRAPLATLKPTVGDDIGVSGLVVLGDCVCATEFLESKLWIHNTATNTSKVHTLEGLRAMGMTIVGKDTDNTLVISSSSSSSGGIVMSSSSSGSLHFVTLNRNTLYITRHTVKDITFQPLDIIIHPVTGQLVVADDTNGAIVTCDIQGNIQNSIKVQTDVGHMQGAVATDDGYVILDSDLGSVHWVDSQGRVTHTYGQGHGQGLDGPCHIMRSSQGQLVIADTNNHRLHLVDASGRLLCYPLTQNDGIKLPSCVWLEEAASLLYVAHGSGGNEEIRVYKWPNAPPQSPLTGNAIHSQHTLKIKLVSYK